MNDRAPIYRSAKVRVAALAAYLLAMGLVVWGVFHARTWALENLSTESAQADWDQWRREADEQSRTGPVRRAKADSPEPPMLVLLRDYFGIMMTGALVFSSLLLATLAVAVHGAFGPGGSRRGSSGGSPGTVEQVAIRLAAPSFKPIAAPTKARRRESAVA